MNKRVNKTDKLKKKRTRLLLMRGWICLNRRSGYETQVYRDESKSACDIFSKRIDNANWMDIFTAET